MKKSKIILSAVALVVTVASAFAFKSHVKKGAGTLYTKASGGAIVDCKIGGTTGDHCTNYSGALFTAGGTQIVRTSTNLQNTAQ